MLDYAANAVVYWPVGELRTRFEARCQARGTDPAEELTGFLGPGTDPGRFWDDVKTNLLAGQIRLVFVSDDIPAELRRIVEFLNKQMSPAEVLAIEMRQYVGPGVRTLVPRVIGQTAEAENKKTAGARTDNQPTSQSEFLAELESRQGDEAVRVVEQVISWSRDHMPRHVWQRSTRYQAFWPCLDHGNESYWPVAFRSNGQIEVSLFWLGRRSPFDDEAMRLDFVKHLNAAGLGLPESNLTGKPTAPLSALYDATSLHLFLDALNWFVEAVQAA
jgi:hypothetical protein